VSFRTILAEEARAMRHFLLTAILALLAIGATFVCGSYRHGALVGAFCSGVTALVSLLLMEKAGARTKGGLDAALMVMGIMFLVRIVVVALATVVVVRAEDNVFAFLVAFFVPYFVFAAIEVAFLRAIPGGSRDRPLLD